MTDHTPTPWVKRQHQLFGEDPARPIATCNVITRDGEANAAFIVRAVNAHEELVSLLASAALHVMPHDGILGQKIESALAKARGGA